MVIPEVTTNSGGVLPKNELRFATASLSSAVMLLMENRLSPLTDRLVGHHSPSGIDSPGA
jgi:hypothetical protein